jgi:hypothetical protein
LNSRNCNLVVHFFHSFDDQPDPLTQLALHDLRESGLRNFVDDCIQELKKDSFLQPGTSDQELLEAVAANQDSLFVKYDLEGIFAPMVPSPREAIRNFHRVALCTPAWPDTWSRTDHREAEKDLSFTMEWLKNASIHAKDFELSTPLLAFARRIGSAYTSGTERLQELLESYASQYDMRVDPDHVSRRVIKVLDSHSQYTRRCVWPFHPSAVRVRCLHWIFSEAVTLETKVLRGCAPALESFFRSLLFRHGRNLGSLGKGVSLLFVPHSLLSRATVEVVLAPNLDPKLPPPILGVLFHLLRDCWELCLTYTLDGTLKNYILEAPSAPFFRRGDLASEPLRIEWNDTCRHYAESIMKAGGAGLGSEAETEPVRKFRERLRWY